LPLIAPSRRASVEPHEVDRDHDRSARLDAHVLRELDLERTIAA
jgi:hypothetical protein